MTTFSISLEVSSVSHLRLSLICCFDIFIHLLFKHCFCWVLIRESWVHHIIISISPSTWDKGITEQRANQSARIKCLLVHEQMGTLCEELSACWLWVRLLPSKKSSTLLQLNIYSSLLWSLKFLFFQNLFLTLVCSATFFLY